MADTRKVVKAFLASPGDLGDARKTAKGVVDEFNTLFADEFGYQVELIGWEDTVSVFGRPQATINRDLERCEFFIGLMWKHWGTPPDLSGVYTSGFEEEFSRSVDRRKREGRPEISLFFKEIDAEFLRDPGPELTKVLSFRDKLIAEKEIYFERFTDLRDFEPKFRRCITKYVLNRKAKDADQSAAQTQTGPENSAALQAVGASGASETPLSAEGAEFLRAFISKTERDVENDPITAAEVARFRLLANLVGSSGNDARTLGVHDANILFVERASFSFGNRELSGLVMCGLERYPNENVPFWHWYAATDGFNRELLPMYSILGATRRRVGALSAMRMISEPVTSAHGLDRHDFVDNWLSEDSANDLKVAALAYLGDFGTVADLPAITRESERNNSQTTGAAIDAIIRINLRDSREEAVRALYELQPLNISPNLLGALFENSASLSTETLLMGIGHKNADVRRITAELLSARRAMPVQTADQLIGDSDAGVRLAALKSLVAAGRTFSDAEAEKALVKPLPTGSYTFGGALGFGGGSARDTAGEACWERYKQDRLMSMNEKELEAAALQDSIFDRSGNLALTERRFAERGGKLRESIDDQFKAEFEREFEAMRASYGSTTDLPERIRRLEKHLRKEFTRRGLDILGRKSDARDLGRVRSALKSGFVDYSAHDIEYLRKFGEWEDIPLIVTSVERPDSSATSLLFAFADDSKYRSAATAIYAMGRTRLAELLAIPMPSRLLSHVVVQASDKTFRGLSDAVISILLHSEHDVVRKAAALKCIKALPKSRVTKLLAAYISSDESHYYNVIHWLDLGVSVSKDRAVGAADRVITMGWRG